MLSFQPDGTKELIHGDMRCWCGNSRIPETGYFNMLTVLLTERPEFRNLLIYRLSGAFGKHLTRFLFRPADTLFIYCPTIGPRLYIEHGFATIISAQSVGSDCWINQQVTVGYGFSPGGAVIGNGVRICAGAKVIGNVKIGDNAIIGANAVVVDDVPEGAVVGGVPARVIGKNEKHRLYDTGKSG